MRFLSTLLIALACFTVSAQAADMPAKKTAQVQSGLYVTAAEAYDILKADPKAVLIDIRDPIEIMFVGFTDEADIHVPFLISDRTEKHAKKPVYAMKKNKMFKDQVQAKLDAMKVSKDAKLIFMCRSGSTRSAPAADMFYKAGYKNAYTVVDGFEGSKRKEGPSKGVRNINGWKNSGLPWGYKLNFEKMYLAEK